MFKDLRTSTKLAILCGVFMTAIGVTTYSLFREKLIAIEFARKELIGAKYLAVVGRFYATVLDTRPLNASNTSTSDSVQSLLKELMAAQDKAAATFQTDEPAQALATALQLWSTNIESGPTHTFALSVLAKAQQLAVRIADDSNLTLDPDLDSYYVQNLLARKLPEFFRTLGELQSLVREATAINASSIEQTERFQFLAGQLRSISVEVGENVAAAHRGNLDGSLKKSIDTAFATMSSRTNSYLQDLNASLDTGDVASLGALATNGSYGRAVASAVEAFATARLELDRLLQKRIDGLLEKMRWKFRAHRRACGTQRSCSGHDSLARRATAEAIRKRSVISAEI